MRYVVFGALLALSACASTTEKNWDCPAQEGVGCKSILESTRQLIGNSSSVAPVGLTRTVSSRSKVSHELQLTSNAVPSWNRDQIMKVYVSPFVDEYNNYHDESVIFTVVSNGSWAGQ